MKSSASKPLPAIIIINIIIIVIIIIIIIIIISWVSRGMDAIWSWRGPTGLGTWDFRVARCLLDHYRICPDPQVTVWPPR